MAEKTELQPALADYYWAQIAKGVDHVTVGAEGVVLFVGKRFGDRPGAPSVLIAPDEERAELAALALFSLPDDSPYKFTRADVEACRALGDADLDAADSENTSPRYAPTLWRLAEKLEALLPPQP